MRNLSQRAFDTIWNAAVGILRLAGIMPADPIAERRKWLDRNIIGLSRPVEYGYLNEIEYLLAPVSVRRGGATNTNERRYLVFVPHFFMEIMFGGYLAFYDFLRRMQRQSGCKLELVMVRRINDPMVLAQNHERMATHYPDITNLFSAFHYLPDTPVFDVDGDYGVISYCAETHYMAASIAEQLGKKPIFFIQDYEPDFHPAGSLKTFVQAAFELPHVGIYNSRILCDYFRTLSPIGIVRVPDYQFATFENPVAVMPWDFERFRKAHAGKTKKRMIVYGRPEPHGSRNEFAIVVYALKQALRKGYLDPANWTFHSIGALVTEDEIELPGNARLSILPKFSYEKYQEYLLQGDVGVSLISTPHPGIIHFQMARFGLATVTNSTAHRSAQWLTSQSRNLIACPLTIDGVCEAMRRAAQLADDVEARHRNAISAVMPTESDDLDAAAKFALSAG